MKLTKRLIFFLSINVIILLYLMQSSFFIPFSDSNDLIYLNVIVLEILLANIIFSFTTLSEFWIKKKLFYGPKEYPSSVKAFYWGLTVGLIFLFILNMHIFHILSWVFSSIIGIIILVILFFIGVL